MLRRTVLLSLPVMAAALAGCAARSSNAPAVSDADRPHPTQPIYIPPQEKARLEDPKAKAAMAPFTGVWLESVLGQLQKEQGFELFADGTAKSVNMATLIYQGWKVDGGKLVLWGKSMGNGGVHSFDETWDVVMVSDKKLVLKRGKFYKTYRKARKQGR